ncbi:hypothetical protein V8G54_028347 [Vigna mungo]|uniref:WAT1-related protein n=1 Tax=Vigna mungo TaxID=3915 RepID=A0AAQ3MS92_VIGMU
MPQMDMKGGKDSERGKKGAVFQYGEAKILGSFVSILGALVVLLYKGSIILSTSSPTFRSPMESTSQTNWILGGSLLAIEYLLVPIWYIVQVLNTLTKTKTKRHLLQKRNTKYNLCCLETDRYYQTIPIRVYYGVPLQPGTLISAPICLLLEENLSAWKINPDVTLVAIVYSVRR